MKSLLLFLTLLLLSGASFAQKVTFDDYKKRGDACFVKLDYQCAKDNYERALRIRDNDAYCKSQLKKVNDALKKASTQTPPKKTPPKVEKESENVRIAELNRKEGDDLFKRGDYEAAQKKYEACLNVPSFGSDAYVKEQIKFCRLAAAFQTDAKNALARGNGLEGLAYLKKILEINSGDPTTRRLIVEHLQQRGNQQFAKNQYTEAKKSYEEALPYADIQTKAVLANLINTTEKELKADTEKKAEAAKVAKQEPKTTPKEPVVETKKTAENKPIEPVVKQEVVKKEDAKMPESPSKPSVVPKIITAGVGVGALAYAFVLNNQYQAKLDNFTALSRSAEYRQWRVAYDDVKAARSKNGLMNVCLGVAVGAVIVESVLLFKKPKEKRAALKLNSASQQWGLALQYQF
jgi:tetratricopeptide (TPR) repeat protein